MKQFSAKLNKRKTPYVITDEVFEMADGKCERYLEHDHVNEKSIEIFTKPLRQGKKVRSYTIEKSEEEDWKLFLRVFSPEDRVYVCYESSGDMVEAEDINLLQQACVNTAAVLEAEQTLTQGHREHTGNPHQVTKSQIGLGNADNTSDMNKPVSVAQGEAIDSARKDADAALKAHAARVDNPHAVTKVQVGLGEVENVRQAAKEAFDRHLSEYAQHTGLFAQHQADYENHKGDAVRHLTAAERAAWNDKYTKNEIDNKFSTLETAIDWKESVASFADIAAAYPNPEDGWTVNVKDTDYTYRFNGTEWVPISANAIPKATRTVDGLLSKEDKTVVDNAGIHIGDAVRHITAGERLSWNEVINDLNARGFKNQRSIVDDFNSLCSPAYQDGMYMIHGAHAPLGAQDWHYVFLRTFYATAVQIAINANSLSPTMYIRSKVNEVWNAWNTMSTIDDIRSLPYDMYRGNAVEDIETRYTTYSANLPENTHYHHLCFHNVGYDILGGGRFFVEGYKSTSTHEYITATSYGGNKNQPIRKFYRTKCDSVWGPWKENITTYNLPASLPANGGNSATVNGYTVNSNVPAGAKFTDTVYTHPATHPASMITGLPASLPANGGTANYTNYVNCNRIADGADLNTITTPGFWFNPSDAETMRMKNCPTDRCFFMIVGRHAGYHQRIVEYTTVQPRIFHRNFYNGVWSPWRKILTEDAVAPTAEVSHKLATDGGSVTLYANNGNEINFGGVGANTTIFFGYRAMDNRPVPTEYNFGQGNATITAGTIYSNGVKLEVPKSLPANGGTADYANLVNGVYTGSGGRQVPSYVVSGKVRFNMMNNLGNYADWILMDTYGGGDVPWVTAFGVEKTSVPAAWVMVGPKGGSEWGASRRVALFTANPASGKIVTTDGVTGGIKAGPITWNQLKGV